MTKEELEEEAYQYDIEHLRGGKGARWYHNVTIRQAYLASAEPREKRISELEAQIEEMKSQYDYAFNQLCESREIVCLMLSQYKNKKEIDYSAKERGEKLLNQGVYKND